MFWCCGAPGENSAGAHAKAEGATQGHERRCSTRGAARREETLDITEDGSGMPLPPSTGKGLFVLKGDGVTKGLRGEHAWAPIGAPVGTRSRRPLCETELPPTKPPPRRSARPSPPSIGGAIAARQAGGGKPPAVTAQDAAAVAPQSPPPCVRARPALGFGEHKR